MSVVMPTPVNTGGALLFLARHNDYSCMLYTTAVICLPVYIHAEIFCPRVFRIAHISASGMPQPNFDEPIGICDISSESGCQFPIRQADARHLHCWDYFLNKIEDGGSLAPIRQCAHNAPRDIALHLAGGQRPALAKWVTGLTTSPGPVSGHGSGLTVAVQMPPLTREGGR